MQQLLILRHAKAVPWSPAAEDFPRKLSSAGNKHAHRIALWMCAELESPQCILCSPSQRTRETLALVCDDPQWMSSDIPITYSRELYLASTSAILEIISDAFEDHTRVMVVGHNPGMDMVLLHFCSGVRLTSSGKLMTTATAAVLEFDGAAMTGARLVDLKRPGDLD